MSDDSLAYRGLNKLRYVYQVVSYTQEEDCLPIISKIYGLC